MKFKVIELEQGSQAWLDYRKEKISATDAASILGIAFKKTALQLWEEKLGFREREAENEKMREGRRLEEEARDFWNKKLGADFKPIVLESTEHDFMIASLDGMNSKGEILEIKCGKASHETSKEHEVAPYYFAQIQQQMYVADVQLAHFLSYRSADDYIHFTIERDDAFIEKMIIAEKEFYRCLMDFTPPPITDKDYIEKDSKEWRMHVKIWKETKNQLRLLEEKEAALREILIAMCDGQSSKGAGVKVTKTIRRGNVDYNKIDCLKSVDLEIYRRSPVTVYRISENE